MITVPGSNDVTEERRIIQIFSEMAHPKAATMLRPTYSDDALVVEVEEVSRLTCLNQSVKRKGMMPLGTLARP